MRIKELLEVLNTKFQIETTPDGFKIDSTLPSNRKFRVYAIRLGEIAEVKCGIIDENNRINFNVDQSESTNNYKDIIKILAALSQLANHLINLGDKIVFATPSKKWPDYERRAEAYLKFVHKVAQQHLMSACANAIDRKDHGLFVIFDPRFVEENYESYEEFIQSLW